MTDDVTRENGGDLPRTAEVSARADEGVLKAAVKLPRIRCWLLCGLVMLALWSVGLTISTGAPAFESKLARIPLAELDPVSTRQGWGSLHFDRSVSGGPLQIGKRKFKTGLGTHANSELVYELGADFDRFEAWVGIDAAMARHPEASVVFKVVADGRELFDSGVMRVDSPARRVAVSTRGVRQLKLIAVDAGDGVAADHADWGDAVLTGASKATQPFPFPQPARFQIRVPGLTLEFSAQGQIVNAIIGGKKLRRALQAGTSLEGCTNIGPVAVRQVSGGGLEFMREVGHAVSGDRAFVVERFQPTTNSIRWEIEVRGTGKPWSTGIQSRLLWPVKNSVRYWTAWEDADQEGGGWRDPLVLQPPANARLWYGAPHWDEEDPQPGYKSGAGNLFSIPILTLAEPRHDLGLSLVLSPEEPLLELSLRVRPDGLFTFSHTDHRISSTNNVRLAMDLVAHPADWRGGLDWMVQRYPLYFNPPNPRADEIGGLGAYSDWEGPLDVGRLKKMGFQVNWKASYDFPYMGMFLPPIGDAEPYRRFVKGDQTSILQLRDYSRRMRQMGFHVLNYFNVTEFGGKRDMPQAIDPSLSSRDSWKNVNNFLYQQIADGILLDLHGKEFNSWEGCIAMDCAGSKYHNSLLEQARRHITKLPDSDGICIDRMDWLRFYDLKADDGLSWRRNQSCRALYCSWRELMAQLGPLFHEADKVIFVNAVTSRLDLMREADGVYHEWGHLGPALNAAALLCVRKPCLAWTPDENTLKPDPDAYFQRHLYLGVFPTAPLPGNDHAITPSAWADQWYLDYGPLFNSLRERKWVLIPHVVEVKKQSAKANLFTVPDGLVMPVCFGERNGRAQITIRNLSELNIDSRKLRCVILYPGKEEAIPLKVSATPKELHLDVRLERGCALVHIYRTP